LRDTAAQARRGVWEKVSAMSSYNWDARPPSWRLRWLIAAAVAAVVLLLLALFGALPV